MNFACQRIFQSFVARNVGLDAAYAHGRFDVERNFVLVVRNPDGENRPVRKRKLLRRAQFALETQRAETAHVADFLHFAAQITVVDAPDGVLQHHLQLGRLARLEIFGPRRPQREKERNGIHAFGRQFHLLVLFGSLAAAPAGVHPQAVPVVGVAALEGVVPLAQVALERNRPQLFGVDVHGIDVEQVVEPAVGGQRASRADHFVEFPAVDRRFFGNDIDRADLRVREHLGLVAHAVFEPFARVVELGEELSRCEKRKQ